VNEDHGRLRAQLAKPAVEEPRPVDLHVRHPIASRTRGVLPLLGKVPYSGLYHLVEGMTPVLALGVDGGGTSTELWLSSVEGEFSAKASITGTNVRTLGPSAAIALLDSAVDRLLERAQIGTGDIAAVVVGLAGIGRARERAPVEEWLVGRFVGCPTRLVTDVELVLAAGTTGTGIAVVSGTGSVAFGRNPAGEVARAGGWGATVGDAGSGLAIGRAALAAVTQAADGMGPTTEITARIVDESRGGSLDDLIAHYRLPADVAALAPVVEVVAAAGDAVAMRILDDAGADLAQLAAGVLRRLGWTDEPAETALGGGVLTHIGVVRDSLLRNLAGMGFRPSPIAIVDEPVRGALHMAAELVTGSAVAK
jgi:N-acetylglucosamine kinase-like BadF-type ATPase